MSKFVAMALVLGAMACGGGDSTGPVSMDTAQAGCQADCQHNIDCGSTEPLADCTTDCVGDVTGVIREDVFNDIVDCNTALACGASDDACEALCEPTSAHDRYEAACRAMFATCPDTVDVNELCSVRPTGASDAGFFCYLTPAIVDEFTACLPSGGTCSAALSCMSGVAETRGVDL